MSRPVIGTVVALVIAVLTAVAYFVTTSRLEARIVDDVEIRVAKAQELLVQNASLEMLGILKRTEALSREPGFAEALTAEKGADPVAIETVFKKFRASLSPGETQPGILAVTDDEGRLIALMSGSTPVLNPLPDTYLKDGKIKYPALALALEQRQLTSAVWNYENNGAMKVAAAPIIDRDLDSTLGAVIVAYPITSVEAAAQQKLLGAEVAFFYEDKVYATSFGEGQKQGELGEPLFSGGLAEEALTGETGLSGLRRIELDGERYIATAGRLPRYSSQPLPAEFPPVKAGAMVLMSITDATAPVASVKAAILALGVASILVALLAIQLTARRILGPLDEIEVGVNDIINGNLDRTFRPVGSDLDGLANALNVMLARLLGRPEPGEEEFDEDGNIVTGTTTMPISTENLSPKDAEAVALAQEPEDAYLRRLFAEFSDARRAAGESGELDFDSFANKLRINEANLRQKYDCRQVRFKVVTDGSGKVTLKPVPIA